MSDLKNIRDFLNDKYNKDYELSYQQNIGDQYDTNFKEIIYLILSNTKKSFLGKILSKDNKCSGKSLDLTTNGVELLKKLPKILNRKTNEIDTQR